MALTKTHRWTFLLTDLLGNVLGELVNASSRQLVLSLNRVPTASFQLPMSHPLAKYVSDPTWDGLVKVYRDNTLRFVGDVVTTNEAYDPSVGQTISVNAAGGLWRLQFRLLGAPSPAGVSNIGWNYGDASTQYDLGAIVTQMMTTANASVYTGISMGTVVTSSNGSAGTYYFKDVLSAISDLSVGTNGIDFEVAPVEPTDLGFFPYGIKIGSLNVAPLFGSVKGGVVFEWGTSRANVASYNRQTDRSQRATFGYIEQPASSTYSGILTSINGGAEAGIQRMRYEALIDNGGVEWDVLRQRIADQAVNIRGMAKQVVNFSPAVNALPTPFTDYSVGDQVQCVIWVHGKTTLNALMRVWGITFDIDQNNNEKVSLELIHP